MRFVGTVNLRTGYWSYQCLVIILITAEEAFSLILVISLCVFYLLLRATVRGINDRTVCGSNSDTLQSISQIRLIAYRHVLWTHFLDRHSYLQSLIIPLKYAVFYNRTFILVASLRKEQISLILLDRVQSKPKNSNDDQLGNHHSSLGWGGERCALNHHHKQAT